MPKALAGDYKVNGREKPKPYTFFGALRRVELSAEPLAAKVKGDGGALGFLLRQQVCSNSTGSVGRENQQ